jgi:radical SAM protein with 4Fe4S-binding SPASM domain
MVTTAENQHTREELQEVWQEADEVRFSVYFNWAGKLENHRRTPNKVNFCERLYHYITILADGRVAMCCFDSEAEYSVGDVKKQSIYEVWHSDAFDQKRRWLYQKNFDQLKLCGQCDYINHPYWTTPLIRIRPYVRGVFPQLTTTVEQLYKRWLWR